MSAAYLPNEKRRKALGCRLNTLAFTLSVCLAIYSAEETFAQCVFGPLLTRGEIRSVCVFGPLLTRGEIRSVSVWPFTH